MFRIPLVLSHKLRHFSSINNHILEELTNRTLIKVSGLEANTFLQGLITNDINHLEHGVGCIYTMFLNTKGRVLYDSLIYKTEEANSFLIECDVDAAPTLQKHLKLYKVKRKIDITSLQNDYKIYALYNPSKALSSVDKQKTSLDGIIVPCNAITNTETEATNETRVIDNLFLYNDPRTSLLGTRIITPDKNCIKEKVSKATNNNISTNSNQTYRWYRYNLGIGEGVTDLPPNNCFPLEANCDYLHGVSFHKGCYIGQELTARTHHTGVVRKRLMPLFLKDVLKTIPENDSIIHDEVNLGKLRGVENNVGLGLLRIAKAIKFDEIKLGTTAATTGKPTWWPIEAPKQKMSA